jgi:hypothetical protein
MSDLDVLSLSKETTRVGLWTRAIADGHVETVVEVGVSRGEFAEALLGRCPGITTYYLIDPWRHLEDWNKPANKDDAKFNQVFDEAVERTAPWESKRVILRGRTTEVVDSIPDGSLDLAYVDGDHTLHGISIDLIRTWPKVRPGGVLGGDDFTPTIWQHRKNFEPTLVFPFAVYFAEAMGVPITALPHNQFIMHKVDTGFTFQDLTGDYGDLTLGEAFGSAQVAPPSHPGPTKSLVRRMRNRLNHSEAVGSKTNGPR